MQDRFNNMINTKILVLVGIIIILSLVGFSMALIGVTFTVNSLKVLQQKANTLLLIQNLIQLILK